MSELLAETIVRATPAQPELVERPSWRRWLKVLVLLVISLWIANAAISFAVQHTALNRRITSRLVSVFGRPVEVGSYDFSLWGRPTLEAYSVVVGEDSRFGREYFLRAESITLRLRWQSLLRGHLEFGAISLNRPSLNLVRNLDGDWNLAEWLPRFSSAPGSAIGSASKAPDASRPLHFDRIDVDAGRINFKRAEEKLPFALTAVTGYVEPEAAGRWRLDLEAAPVRTAVILQQPGILHLSGHVGGTSSRLRPAALDLSWTDASIADVLRLARGADYGIRGDLAVALRADTDAQDWKFDGRAEVRHVHRWNLPLRVDNPSVNLIAKGTLDPALARFEVANSTVETPRSNAHIEGAICWDQPCNGQNLDEFRSALRIVSSDIDMSDFLAWARAFHPGIAEDLALRGLAKLNLTVGGWPPRLDEGMLSAEDADLTGKTMSVPVHLALPSLRYDSKAFSLAPASISFGSAAGALRVETISPPPPPSRRNSLAHSAPVLHVSGTIADAGNLISAARLLGWDISRGWDVRGPLRCDLKWPSGTDPWRSSVGTLDFGVPFAEAASKQDGDSLRAPFLNLPVEQIRAHLELKSSARHVVLASADAFGAHWTGTLDRHEPAADQRAAWQFSLSADHLSASDLDRWLNPRWRETLLDRVLPFLNSPVSEAAQSDRLVAGGKLTIDQFTLAPFQLHRLQGDASIDGGHIALLNVRAQLAKGDIAGSLRASLGAVPSYDLNFGYSGIDLYALTSAAPSLADRFAGVASGNISILTMGAGRSDLISSLQCQGSARIAGAELMGIDLSASFDSGAFRPGHSAFHEAYADFACSESRVVFQRLRLFGTAQELAGRGSVDFRRNLDLTLTDTSNSASFHPASASDPQSPSYRLTGNLSEPEITRLKQLPARP